MTQENPELPSVEETIVNFRMLSDRTVYSIVNEATNQPMVEISGYALNFLFNMEYINTVEDIETACSGLSQLFRELIMEKLLEQKQMK